MTEATRRAINANTPKENIMATEKQRLSRRRVLRNTGLGLVAPSLSPIVRWVRPINNLQENALWRR